MIGKPTGRPATPFFSIVVCSWNRAHLLPRALDSLLAQTERSWEVVVVNDASNDDTMHVLQKYEERLPSMHCILNNMRVGTPAARNQGIRQAGGRYVTFLDSDDAYMPSHLSSRKELLETDPTIDLLHGGVMVVGDEFVIDKNNPSKTIPISQCAVGGTFVIRREVFTTVGMFNETLTYADDAEFLERATAAGVHIATAKDPTYIYYRNVEGQLTSTWTGN